MNRVKESSKKKLMRSTWASYVENGRYKTGKESKCPESGREMEAEKPKLRWGLH